MYGSNFYASDVIMLLIKHIRYWGPSINNVINSLPSPLFWLKSQNILRSNVFQFFIIFFTYLHEVNIVQVLQPPESSMAISDLYDDTKCCFLKQLGFINF